MYSIKKLTGLLAAALFIITISAKTYANDSSDKSEVEKIRQEVKNADPSDWQTLANCADKCFRKKINVDEALVWIDKSIEIDPNAENYTIKGDYYYRNKMPNNAIELYLKALSLNDPIKKNLENQAIQTKIKRAMELKEKGY